MGCLFEIIWYTYVIGNILTYCTYMKLYNITWTPYRHNHASTKRPVVFELFISFQAALSLPERPPFHSTTVVLLVDIILLVFSTILDLPSLILLCMIFTVAWISHHVRDAVRRWLWFYPFGSTPPLPKIVYIGIILMLPLVMGILFRKFYLKDKQNSITTSFETHAQIVWNSCDILIAIHMWYKLSYNNLWSDTPICDLMYMHMLYFNVSPNTC